MTYSREKIEAAVKSKGYVWFEGLKDYDLNIVGVRNSSTGNTVTNAFDDLITVSYKIGGNWVYKQWPATTEEELYKLCHFTNLQPLWAEENLSKGNRIL